MFSHVSCSHASYPTPPHTKGVSCWYGLPYYIIRRNHDMVEEGVHKVPTLRNRVVIFLKYILTTICNNIRFHCNYHGHSESFGKFHLFIRLKAWTISILTYMEPMRGNKAYHIRNYYPKMPICGVGGVNVSLHVIFDTINTSYLSNHIVYIHAYSAVIITLYLHIYGSLTQNTNKSQYLEAFLRKAKTPKIT